MKKRKLETIIGITISLVAIFFTIFVFKTTNKKFNQETYTVFAKFTNVEGIGIGSKVKIGGMDIGSVKTQSIDENYKIKLTLKIFKDIKIPTDSTITISTSGIIGSKYLKIQAGGNDEFIEDNGEFEFTQSTMDLEDMITKFMFNKVNNKQ